MDVVAEAAAEADAVGVVVGTNQVERPSNVPTPVAASFYQGGSHRLFAKETIAFAVMPLMRTSIAAILVFTALTVMAGAGTASADEPPELTVEVVGVAKKSAAPGVRVRFENHMLTPLKILRPLDGSEWGWHMPQYALSIVDSTGMSIPMGTRCGMSGLYSGLKWPDDYLIRLRPGDAYEMTVNLYRSIPVRTRYRVSFSYTYSTLKKPGKENTGIQYPDDLWRGTATSKPVELELPTSP